MQAYTSNLSFIEKSKSTLWKNLQNHEPHFERAQNGSLTLRHRGIYIESKYDPERHAERFIKGVPDESKTVILLGSGLGYHINSLFQRGIFRAILIEKDPVIFKAALHVIKPEFLRRIFLLIDESPDWVNEKLLPFLKDRIVFVKHPQSTALYREYYSSVELLVRRGLKERIASRITELGMQRQWVRNILKNLKGAGDRYYGSKEFHTVFCGPVLLIASGPWLEEIVDDIFQLSKKMPVFSLLPSVPFLLKQGLDPDLVITTDAGFGNIYRFLRNVETPLMTTFSASPAVLKNWSGKVFLFSHGLPFEEHLHTVWAFTLKIPMQGTSSAVMIALARQMGFTEIFLAGFDFAYRGLRDHHTGAGFENYYNSTSYRFHTWQTAVAGTFKRDLPVKSSAGSGKSIYSTHKLMLYKEWVESEVADSDLYRLGNGVAMENVKSYSNSTLYVKKDTWKLDFIYKMEEKGNIIISSPTVQEDLLRIKALLNCS